MGDLKKVLKYVVFFLLSGLIILSIAVLIIWIVVVVFEVRKIKAGQGNNNEGITTYKSLRFNPENNETSYGFVYLPNSAPISDLSFEEEDGSLVLISKFDDNEYKCKGTCICNEPDSNRRITTLLTVTIWLLVIAVTLGYAYYKAKQFFMEICRKELKAECEAEYIELETGPCDPIVVEKASMKMFDSVGGRGEPHRFICSGTCSSSFDSSSRNLIGGGGGNDYICDTIDISSILYQNCPSSSGDNKDCFDVVGKRFAESTGQICEVCGCKPPLVGGGGETKFHCIIQS